MLQVFHKFAKECFIICTYLKCLLSKNSKENVTIFHNSNKYFHDKSAICLWQIALHSWKEYLLRDMIRKTSRKSVYNDVPVICMLTALRIPLRCVELLWNTLKRKIVFISVSVFVIIAHLLTREIREVFSVFPPKIRRHGKDTKIRRHGKDTMIIDTMIIDMGHQSKLSYFRNCIYLYILINYNI